MQGWSGFCCSERWFRFAINYIFTLVRCPISGILHFTAHVFLFNVFMLLIEYFIFSLFAGELIYQNGNTLPVLLNAAWNSVRILLTYLSTPSTIKHFYNACRHWRSLRFDWQTNSLIICSPRSTVWCNYHGQREHRVRQIELPIKIIGNDYCVCGLCALYSETPQLHCSADKICNYARDDLKAELSKGS